MIGQLIYVGFNSQVVALDRDTGDVVWKWSSPEGSGYVTILIDGDRLIVSVDGYTYCLNPETGAQIWFNPLKGMGTGVTSLASIRGIALGMLGAADAEEAARRRRDTVIHTSTSS